ncbi:DUF6685 family protein [Pseudomonas sp. 5P_3.1_Bac2]|uniref:DUF6685 family protein n=1 Tax=Pseudomonas sp. 5P_3.1_Bac2 TaxID=2971617 RepID=UPI0021C69709|nr:DUF6685 family protein [Pseudomonas sp. 5P_3.1_Bac2]MCU1716281.1 hypothetical protein [Pseudomonas sp. 5P_3.1_Bac2]
MSLSKPTTRRSSRLAEWAQRLGLTARVERQILQRASQLKLPFKTYGKPAASICWYSGPQLHRLVDLPSNALSGPVQEDKAQAHAMLVQIVELQSQQFSAFDLRKINGLSNCTREHAKHLSFESLASSEACKSIRIISYRDFVRVISQALPDFSSGPTIQLRQASWLGERTFWAGEQQHEAFACAISYARRRDLEVRLPTQLSRYRLSQTGLNTLHQHYHVFAIPNAAWNDAGFMSLLLDSHLPYARLALLGGRRSPEVLMLPKHSSKATALGEGLRLAGAPDIIEYLQRL